MLLLPLAVARDPGLRLPDGEPRPSAYDIALAIDPAAPTFRGEETVTYALAAPTRRVWLNARGLTVTAVSEQVDGVARPARVHASDDWLRVNLPVRAASFTLSLQWTGPVNPVATQGVFVQSVGEDRYVFSQFEATDARAAFPSLDQPDVKTPFTLAITVPDGLSAFANTNSVTTDDAGPTRTFRFAPTRPLPTYLLAFAVGPFEAVDAGRAGQNAVPVRILVPRGAAAQAAYAAERTAPILAELERYFELPYPYPKLDVAVIPLPVGFGAMENPGLVTFASTYALSRPEDDSVSRRRTYVEFMAHELAHQWFGDLVTPRWWDDLWLNESFASWMGTRVTAALEPGWHLDVERVATRDGAMRLDALPSARAIRQPIEAAEDIESAFDGITYGKGEAVLGMIEAQVGAERFQAGVRAYLGAHADGVATTDDFLAALSQAAGADLSAQMAGFLDRAGVPFLTLGRDGATLALTQTRFRGEAGAPWQLPVCVRFTDDTGEKHACTVLDQAEARWTLPAVGAVRTLVPDDGAFGYYRLLLPPDELRALLAPSAPLSVAERVAVVANTAALVEAGKLPPGLVLGALPELVALGEPQLLGRTIAVVAALDAHLVPEDLRPNYQRMIEGLYGEEARRLGLSARPDEDEDTRLLRPALVALVGGPGGDPTLRAAARPLADAWLSTRSGLDPELLDEVLALGVQDGDAALFARVEAEMFAEPDRERRQHLLTALGRFRDPARVEEALALVLDPRVDIREALGLVGGVLGHPDTAEVAWRWFTVHADAVAERLPLIARGYLPYFAQDFCDTSHRVSVEEFFRRRARSWPGSAHNLDLVLDGIDACIASRAEQEGAIREALAAW